MTYKPPGPFDSLIKDLLGNVQRNADATMRRLETRDERNFQRDMLEQQQDFAREQVQTQRGFQLDDRQYEEDRYYTDQADALLRESMKGMRDVLPFLIGTPDFEDAQALIAEMSKPHGLRGREALDYVTNLTVNIAGRPVNLAGSLARWQASADQRIRSEDLGITLVAEWLPKVADGSLPEETRDGYLDAILSSSLITEDLKEQALTARGITNPEDRELRRQELEQGRAQTSILQSQAKMLSIDAEFHQAFVEGDLAAMEDAARARKEELGHSDYQAFWDTGYLPENEAAFRQLAFRVANNDPDLLRAMADTNRNRYAGVIDARARTELAGADLAETEARAADWSFGRTQLQADFKDAEEAATNARAAVLAGDVPYLQMLKAFQETGAFGDVLAHLDIDAWISEAQDIHQTGAAQRQRVRQQAFVEGQADIDVYVRGIAASFTLDDFEMGLDGEWAGLESAVEAELKQLSQGQLEALGLTREQLRERLLRESKRALLQNELSETQQRLAALEAAIPDDEAQRLVWAESYKAGLQLLGFTEEEAETTVAGILDAQDRQVGTWRASTARLWQEVDLFYQQTVGQYLDNVRDDMALQLMLEGGASMSLEEYRQLVGLYNDIAQRGQDMVNSEACGVPAAEAMWVAGTAQVPKSFQPELPGCQQALDDANNARRAMQELAAQARFGPDGMVILGGQRQASGSAAQRSQVGGAAADPAVPLETIAGAFEERGIDAASFDERAYRELPDSVQRGIYQDILRGASPEEVNTTMTEALFMAAVADGYLIPDSQAPTLEESGLQVRRRVGNGPMTRTADMPVFNLSEWAAQPITARITKVAGTREWQEYVADLVNEAAQEGVSIEELSDRQVADLAVRFGLWSEEAVRAKGVEPQPSGGVDIGQAVQAGMSGFQPHDPADWDARGAGPGTDALMRQAQQIDEMVRGASSGTQRGQLVFEGDDFGSRSIELVDLDATREAVNATALELQRRGVEWLLNELEIDQAMRDLETDAQAPPPATAQGSGSASAEMTGSARRVGSPPGQASEYGPGGPGDYSHMQQQPAGEPSPVDDMEISPQGQSALRNHEGLRLEAYWDVNGWAIGYGHRSGVKEGDTITREQAEEFFRQDTQWVADSIRKNITVPLTQEQFDALASLVYNVGPSGWLSVAEKINEGDLAGAEAAWLSHNKARQGEGGELVALPGLTNRRRAEWAMFAGRS